ncbi:hypothetical protein G6F63_016125 [Rhizopus arrhizus]|nr:hypothetical protein G6F63_016125 [Rhizopus arrhizus]
MAQTFDLQLNRQAVAIEARHIRREIALQPFELHYRVLQAFIDGMAKVQAAVGIGRPVVQQEERARALRAMQAVDDRLARPAPQGFRLVSVGGGQRDFMLEEI